MDVPVVRLHPESRDRHLDLLRWGLVPFNTADLKATRKPINARSETVATSPMFRAAFAKRRCLVPAAAFYEWRTTAAGKSRSRSRGLMANRSRLQASGKDGGRRMVRCSGRLRS